MKITSSVLTIAVVTLLMRYLMTSSKKDIAENEDGVLVFRMNKAYGIVGILGIIIASIFAIIGFLGTVKTMDDFIMVLLLILFFLCISVPLVLVSRNQKIVASDEKIIFYGMTGKCKEILWADITKVKFSKTSLELKLIANSTSIKLHMHLVGFNKFIELMQENLDIMLYKDAINTMQAVQKRYA